MINMLDTIYAVVCDGENIPRSKIEEVDGKTRKREVVFARQVIMYFGCEFTIGSFKYIGDHVAHKDHATVNHAKKTINNLIDTDSAIAVKINDYRNKILIVSKINSLKSELQKTTASFELNISKMEERLLNIKVQLADLQNQINSLKY